MTYPDLALDDAAADAAKLIATITDLAELAKIERQAAQQGAQIRASLKAEKIAECHRIAADVQMTAVELMSQPDKPAKRAALFRHPDGREWAGLGRVPDWIKARELAGGSRSEFAVA